MANQPAPADFTRLSTGLRNLERQVKLLNSALVALNTNLVAIHELLKEKTDDDSTA